MNTLFPNTWLSKGTCWLLIIIFCFNEFNLSKWNESSSEIVIHADVVSYYGYLPAFFIHHDLSLAFIDQHPEQYKSYHYYYQNTVTGKKVFKTTMGMALLYLPFFLVAHIVELAMGQSPTGFEPGYVMWLVFSSAFYVGLGLIFLRRILDRYFTPVATSLTLIAVMAGTNLYYYTTYEPCMAHSYGFGLLVMFLYLLIQWQEAPTYKLTMALGLVAGLIALVRPTNILVLLLIPLWGVVSGVDFANRIVDLFTRWRMVLLMMLCFVVVWLPQLIYWYAQTGHFFFFSYTGESFYWNQPAIVNGLFSYRKGWLLYTPVMIFSLLGIPFLWSYLPKAKWAVLVFLVANIYVLLSWWAWWYGGSYGNRAFVDLYGILALPIAAFITWCMTKGKAATVTIAIVILLLVGHNVFQMFQFRKNAIHWDAMTKAAYWDSFGHLTPSPGFNGLLDHRVPRQPTRNSPQQ